MSVSNLLALCFLPTIPALVLHRHAEPQCNFTKLAGCSNIVLTQEATFNATGTSLTAIFPNAVDGFSLRLTSDNYYFTADSTVDPSGIAKVNMEQGMTSNYTVEFIGVDGLPVTVPRCFHFSIMDIDCSSKGCQTLNIDLSQFNGSNVYVGNDTALNNSATSTCGRKFERRNGGQSPAPSALPVPSDEQQAAVEFVLSPMTTFSFTYFLPLGSAGGKIFMAGHAGIGKAPAPLAATTTTDAPTTIATTTGAPTTNVTTTVAPTTNVTTTGAPTTNVTTTGAPTTNVTTTGAPTTNVTTTGAPTTNVTTTGAPTTNVTTTGAPTTNVTTTGAPTTIATTTAAPTTIATTTAAPTTTSPTLPPISSCPEAPFYRYWNAAVEDHFYTTNYYELETGRDGYRFEGYQASLKITSCDDRAVPLFRYFFPGVRANHFYTTQSSEVSELAASIFGQTYQDEGIAGYCFPDASAGPSLVPLYRYFNALRLDHFYTTNADEIGTTTPGETGKNGYTSEGIACYIVYVS